MNRQCPKACGLRPRGLANAQPTHGVVSSTGGSRTHRQSRRFELRRFSVCVPCQIVVEASPMGFEPTISTLTGWRALRTTPRGLLLFLLPRAAFFLPYWSAAALASGSGGSRTHGIPGSKPRWSASYLPSHCVVSTQSRSRTCKHSGLSRAALPVGVSGHVEPKWSRMELNHRFLDVSQASLPLDHGTVLLSGPTGNRTRISGMRRQHLPVGR